MLPLADLLPQTKVSFRRPLNDVAGEAVHSLVSAKRSTLYESQDVRRNVSKATSRSYASRTKSVSHIMTNRFMEHPEMS